ncbi:MAG: protein kinase, partial [Verrucomicrobiota bacterium]
MKDSSPEDVGDGPPDAIGGFVMLQRDGRNLRIGEGGSGSVYIAEPAGKGEPAAQVALKIIPLQSDNKLAAREVESVRQYKDLVPSPYLIPVLDHGTSEDQRFFWYTMPLADDASGPEGLAAGTYEPMTLAKRIAGQDREPIHAREALEIGHRICAGIAALEARGHAHLDLKPENILYKHDVVQIADMGLISRKTQENPGVINPYYSFFGGQNASESFLLQDLSALGAILHQLLIRSDEPPWLLLKPDAAPSDEPDVEIWHGLFDIASRSHMGEEKSFKTVGEVVGALEALAQGKYTVEKQDTARPFHHRALMVLTPILLLVVAFLIGRAMKGEGPEQPPVSEEETIEPTPSPAGKEVKDAAFSFDGWERFAVVPYRDKILLSGGWYKDRKGVLSAFYAYDPSSKSYTRLPPMPKGRKAHQMVIVGDDVYILG